MMMRLILPMIAAMLIPVASYGDTVTVQSGSGVTFLDSGNTSTDFSSAFAAGNFTSAQTGPAALLIAPNGGWVSSLSSGPGAVWIGTNSSAGSSVGDTALYAISFDIADPFVSASFSMFFAVDNQLGDTNPGIYLNGNALPASTGLGSFDQQYTYTAASVEADLVQGTNWLYIDAVNTGGPAGLMFSATTTTVNAASTPEPASFYLLLTALVAGAACRGFRNPAGGVA
jgi:hypothetical protein